MGIDVRDYYVVDFQFIDDIDQVIKENEEVDIELLSGHIIRNR